MGDGCRFQPLIFQGVGIRTIFLLGNRADGWVLGVVIKVDGLMSPATAVRETRQKNKWGDM